MQKFLFLKRLKFHYKTILKAKDIKNLNFQTVKDTAVLRIIVPERELHFRLFKFSAMRRVRYLFLINKDFFK